MGNGLELIQINSNQMHIEQKHLSDQFSSVDFIYTRRRFVSQSDLISRNITYTRTSMSVTENSHASS